MTDGRGRAASSPASTGTARPPGADSALLWAAFGAVHVWLALLGLVLRPESTWDVELYRRWVEAGVQSGSWPVLDVPWVYPFGALLPLGAAAPAATSPGAYAVAWFLLLTLLDAGALAVLVRLAPHGRVGAWWWLAALVALGPVSLGRLDGVVVPLTVVALVHAVRRPGLAAALLTVGAWIKVAPGAVVLALAASARRPWRTVVLPAALVSAVIVGLALAGGAGGRVTSFLSAQGSRGLQIESVAATPYSLARWFGTGIWADHDTVLNTYQVAGADTGLLRLVLDVVLVVGVAAVTWLARRAVRAGADRGAVLLTAALALQLTLIVANKVGSPQFVAWLVAPVTVALARDGWAPPWRLPALGVLLVAALTQWVFPLDYTAFLWAQGPVVVAAALRNVLLVVLLVQAVAALVRLPDQVGAAATVTR